MAPPTAAAGPVPPWGLAVAAMASIQLGSALSVELIDTVGPAGTAWLRLTMGAALLLAFARPRLRAVHRGDLPALLGLGITTGLMTMAFLAAIERIPLGTAVAIEFLGPLTVAAVRSHSPRALAWPALALLGLVLLTEPWHGNVDLAGVGFAALAGVGWGTYIVLTQHIGDRFVGITGLAFSIPIAAATTATLGVPQATGHLTAGVLAAALALALLVPVLPFALEMLALRRMTHAAFGTLMALEPAIGTVLGLVVLGQNPSIVQLVGVALVVLAAMAAQRNGRRHPPGITERDRRARDDVLALGTPSSRRRRPQAGERAAARSLTHPTRHAEALAEQRWPSAVRAHGRGRRLRHLVDRGIPAVGVGAGSAFDARWRQRGDRGV